MSERNQKQNEGQHIEIEKIVASAVSQALQAQVPALQAQIVQQVLNACPVSTAKLPRRPEHSRSPWFMPLAISMRVPLRKKFCALCWMRAVSIVLASRYSW